MELVRQHQPSQKLADYIRRLDIVYMVRLLQVILLNIFSK